MSLLLGLPGSGKTFALTEYAAEVALTLTERCLSEYGDPQDIYIPLFVDLTSYNGNLRSSLKDILPVGLELSEALIPKQSVIILDAANEMPREYIDNRSWIADFASLRSEFPDTRFVVGCRNEEWVKSIGLPIFLIADIDRRFVTRQFFGDGLDRSKHTELITALTKPLLFGLAKRGDLNLSSITTPADVYEAFWANLNANWARTQGCEVDLATILEGVAYKMLAEGVEYATKIDFEVALATKISDPEKLLAMLLKQGALVPLSGQRLTFGHQCLTEYLAARVVSRRYSTEPDLLQRLMRDKRLGPSTIFSCRASSRGDFKEIRRRLIPLSQVDQYLGLAGRIRSGAGFDLFGGS